MTHEANEVSAPDSVAAPTHVMSEEGAARLAALTQEQLAPPEPKADPVDETVKAGLDKQEPADLQADRTTPRPEVDVSAIEPLAVSDRYREEAEAYREDMAHIVADTGIPASEVNAIFQVAGGMAAEMLAIDESNAMLGQGQNAGPSMRNPDETHSRLLARYGAAGYGAVIQAAAKEYNALPERVRNYLSAPNEHGDRIENHPAAVIALALRGFARLAPEAAEKEMGRLRGSEAFTSGDKLTLDKVRMLAHVIAGKKPEAPRPPQPNRGIVYKREDYGTRGGDPAHPGQGTQAAAALRAELKKLQAKDSDLFSSDGPKRKRAIARRQEIHALLEGGSR
jgi:hypothetical protein